MGTNAARKLLVQCSKLKYPVPVIVKTKASWSMSKAEVTADQAINICLLLGECQATLKLYCQDTSFGIKQVCVLAFFGDMPYDMLCEACHM